MIEHFKPDDKEARALRVGSTDIATIAGLNPYQSAVKLWAIRTGLINEDPLGMPAQFGLDIESNVLKWWSKEKNRPIRRVSQNQVWVHPEHKIMYAHLDARTFKDSDGSWEIVEAKTTGPYYKDEWGRGMYDIPRHYLMQIIHQLICTPASCVSSNVTVRIGNEEQRHYHIPRSPELLAIYDEFNLWQKAYDFVEMVKTRKPPEPRSTDDQLLIYPKSEDRTVQADEKTRQLFKQLYHLREESTKETERLKMELMGYMGDAMKLAFGKSSLISWKTNKAGERVFKPNWRVKIETI